MEKSAMIKALLKTSKSVCRKLHTGKVVLFAALAFCIGTAPESIAAAADSAAEPVAASENKVVLSKADLATANGSARIGVSQGNICCVLTSIQTRVQLEPDKWVGDDEATSWTTWLTAFDDNLYSNWLKNAPLNAQETVGIRINPDSTVAVTNNTFFPGKDVKDSNAQANFEAAIVASVNETLKMAKPMPATKNKLKEVHMSLTFMRGLKAIPRVGKNEYGFLALVGDKDFTTVYERTSDDGRFPGIQIMTDNADPGKVVPLEQAAFNQKVAEAAQE
jgi:hypothetical protein